MRIRALLRAGALFGAGVLEVAFKDGRKAADEMERADAFRRDGNVVGLIQMLDSHVRGRSKYSIVRGYAATELGRMGDPRAIPYLMEMRDDPEEQVRSTVITALGRLKATEAVPFLLETLSDDESQLLRLCAGSALAEIGAVEAIPAFWKLLDSDPDRVIRFRAVESLVILGDRAARERVPEVLSAFTERELARDPFKRLREAVESGDELTPWDASRRRNSTSHTQTG